MTRNNPNVSEGGIEIAEGIRTCWPLSACGVGVSSELSLNKDRKEQPYSPGNKKWKNRVVFKDSNEERQNV